MGKLSKLKNLKSKAVAPKPSDHEGMEGLFLDSMAKTAASIGAVSAGKTGKDWASTKIELIPGVSVVATTPPGAVVEIDGMTLVEEMVNAAERVFPAVVTALTKEKHSLAVTPAYDLLAEVCDVEKHGHWSNKAVMLSIIRRMMRAQGWRYVKSRDSWASPPWLFPPLMVTWATMEAMVSEEIDFRSTSPGTPEAFQSNNPLDLLEEL